MAKPKAPALSYAFDAAGISVRVDVSQHDFGSLIHRVVTGRLEHDLTFCMSFITGGLDGESESVEACLERTGRHAVANVAEYLDDDDPAIPALLAWASGNAPPAPAQRQLTLW